MVNSFTVAVFQEDGWFSAKCLQNSIVSQGMTMDEALSNLKAALELFYEGIPVPVFPKVYVTTVEITQEVTL